MECPFKLPVEKELMQKDGTFIDGKIKLYRIKPLFIPYTEEEADYIVQAINCHEKLVDVCRNALTSLAITMLPRLDNNVASDNDIIKIVISSLEQALKEAEKK